MACTTTPFWLLCWLVTCKPKHAGCPVTHRAAVRRDHNYPGRLLNKRNCVHFFSLLMVSMGMRINYAVRYLLDLFRWLVPFRPEICIRAIPTRLQVHRLGLVR